ncbi:MAG: four-carbon acid sugar kinase family protein [Mucilaginibacter sp.]|uniref:four-carbon acid sugar kinase family protein n=1 Tax=Mucilaginibacter sp. TaxID=1882438 RepID=UPI0032654750
MIIVIADDFTGAAELGGIGLRYNLKVEVNTSVNLQSKADLLVIATDTRSMTKNEAVAEMERVTEQVVKLNPTLIFKKVDSVLRGYVAEELLAHIQKLSHTRALLVPANPGLGRTIVNGQYLLNGQPLHQSNFATDPDFPVQSSSVIELLDGKGIKISSQKHTETLNFEGIVVGDAADHNDLKAWTNRVNRNMIIAGAANFFTALLDKVVIPDEQSQQKKARSFEQPVLIVSGTAFKKSADAIRKLKDDGFPVSYMPANIIRESEINEEEYLQWCDRIVADITKFGKTIIAIDPHNSIKSSQSRLLRQKTATIVNMVCKQIHINELLIEGGSTAAAILKQLGIAKLYPVEELALGVIRMSADDDSELYITIKPGSYAWPQSVSQYTSY